MTIILMAARGCLCRNPATKQLLRKANQLTRNVTVLHPGQPGYKQYLTEYGRDVPYLIIDGERKTPDEIA